MISNRKRLFLTTIIFLLFTLFSYSVEGANNYIQIYQGITNGAFSWTGNTQGLSKATNQNNPGTRGSNGAFITLDTLSQVNSFPAGTTLVIANNSSSAVLDIPSGSTILYAELIWGGSYDNNSTPTANGALNASVTLRGPDNVTHSVAPNPATRQSVSNQTDRGFYVCTQNVTSIIQAQSNPQGTYTVGAVPGTIDADNNDQNTAGWTLAVAYSNPNMKTSQLTLYVGCIITQKNATGPIVQVTGFTTPSTGSISARLFSSAISGDAQLVGDQLKIGLSTPPTTNLSGTNNPVNNFFASQINTLLPLTTEVATGKLVATGSSLLDTRGTFGTRNANAAAGTNISGGRQGWDITSVDTSSIVSPGVNTIYLQGTTNADTYVISSLGVQIQTDAPILVATKSANVSSAAIGDTITYSFSVTNSGGNQASNMALVDVLPTGLSFVNGSFVLNGVSQPGVTYTQLSTTGVPVGNPSPNLPIGNTTTFSFQAQVVSTSPDPQPSSYSNFGTLNYTFNPFGTPISLSTQTNTVVVNSNVSPGAPVANNDTATATAGTILNQNTSVLANDTGTGTLSIYSYTGTTTQGGTVTMVPSGSSAGTYTYTPPASFSGSGVSADTFTYSITDSTTLISNNATVTITVLPYAVPDSVTVTENTPFTQNVSVLNNDIGTGLFINSYDTTSVAGGTISMAPNGTYTYTPPTGFTGDDVFYYTLEDASGQTAQTNVAVLVVPMSTPGTGTTFANQPYNGVTTPIPSGVTITSFQNPTGIGGTVSMTTSGPSVGAFTYTPPLNYSGLDTFTYTLSNGGGGTITMTVLPVAVNDTGTTFANVPLVQGVSVLANDAGSGLSIIPASMNLVSLQGGTVMMNTNGTYTYTPPLNYAGQDVFTYIAKDSPLGNLAQATVTITIDPSADPTSAITYANTPLTNAPSVLGPNSGNLVVVAVQTPSDQGGSVTMNSDGTYVYIPPTGYSGIDTFDFTVQDPQGGTAVDTVTITVIPLVNPATGTTPRNTPLQSDVDLAGDVGIGLSVVPYTGSTAQGGTITFFADGSYLYTPPLNFVGEDVANFTVVDAASSSVNSTLTITVTPAAAPPSNFTGCLSSTKFINKTQYTVSTHWTASPSQGIVSYRIYRNGVLVRTVPAGGALSAVICLNSKDQASGLTITSVNSQGEESVPVTIVLQC